MRAASILKWLGRILSLVLIGFLVMMLTGEGMEFGKLSTLEMILMAFFPVGGTVGFVISWWRELPGAVVTLAGLGGFYLVHLFGSDGWPRGPYFVIFAVPSFLFLASSFLKRRKHSRDADPD